MKTLILLGAISFAVTGCNNERGAPGRDESIRIDAPVATPSQPVTPGKTNQGLSVPREGGNLDRGVTLSNNPAQNAPGPSGQALDKQGSGFGKDTK